MRHTSLTEVGRKKITYKENVISHNDHRVHQNIIELNKHKHTDDKNKETTQRQT